MKKKSPLFVDSVFFQSWKKTESTKSGDSVFFLTAFPPPMFFFTAEIFGLLSPSLPPICWSQAFGYGFLASYCIIICTRPNFLKTLLRKKATYFSPTHLAFENKRQHLILMEIMQQGRPHTG